MNQPQVKQEEPIDAESQDVKELSVDEKYQLILANVKAHGPIFLCATNPSTYALPDRDPLNLVWINLLTAWTMAAIILNNFEASQAHQEEQPE